MVCSLGPGMLGRVGVELPRQADRVKEQRTNIMNDSPEAKPILDTLLLRFLACLS